MRPSLSVSLDPGLERGVPWGRDLYSFVTSAAGHMMRTLQKPRKNRPSKRQVNHRRFLHNMIQRKFADIEAANHRLASAIYFKDEERNVPSLSSHNPGTPEQSGNPSQRECPDDVCSSDEMIKPTESDEQKHQHQHELQSSTCGAQMNNQSESGQREETDHKPAESTPWKGSEDQRGPEIFHLEDLGENGTWKPMNSLSDDTQTSLKESGFRQFDQNVDMCFSPELSPLSLDSYDFPIQAPTDKSVGLQAQRSLTDICEGQLNDIMDLLCVGSEDFGGCADLETYFDSMCACQGGAGPENEADDVTCVEQSDGFTEDLLCDQSGPTYIYRHSCHEDQEPSTNQRNQQKLRSSVYTPGEEELYSDANLLHGSAGRHCSAQLHADTREKSTCMLLTCDPNPNFTPFEGVAQSFSVPPLNPENRPIPTPPHEDDWLFTDILKDRKSPDFP